MPDGQALCRLRPEIIYARRFQIQRSTTWNIPPFVTTARRGINPSLPRPAVLATVFTPLFIRCSLWPARVTTLSCGPAKACLRPLGLSLTFHPSHPANHSVKQFSQWTRSLCPSLLAAQDLNAALAQPVHQAQNCQRLLPRQPIQRPDKHQVKLASPSIPPPLLSYQQLRSNPYQGSLLT